MITACPHAPVVEKNRGKKQQTDPRDEDKKKKQQDKLRMNIRNAYISACNTSVSRRENTLG